MTCNKKIFLTPQPLAGNGFGLGEVAEPEAK